MKSHVQTWKSFIPISEKKKSSSTKEKFVQMEKQLQQPSANKSKHIPNSLDQVKVNQASIKSLNDSAWTAMNNVDKQLILETGQFEVFEKRERHEMLQQKEMALQASQRKKRIGNQLISTSVQEQQQQTRPVMEKETIPSTVPVVQSLPVEDLDEHHFADNDTALFLQKLKKQAHVSDSIISTIPPRRQILRYIAEHKDEVPWYEHDLARVIDTEGLDFQNMEVVNRKYIGQFLREADPDRPEERPCMNLDHDPRQGEIGIRCESHRLSADLLGIEKAFKCREFLLPTIESQIAAAKKHNVRVLQQQRRGKVDKEKGEKKLQMVDPCKWLPEIPEFCYLCYLKFVNRSYYTELFNLVERNTSDLTKDNNVNVQGNDQDEQVLYHKFMVAVGPGEYDLRFTLTGDRSPHGIAGPFPLYMESCYAPYKLPNGLWSFQESDELVFRPGQEQPLHQSTSLPQLTAEGNISSQLTH